MFGHMNLGWNGSTSGCITPVHRLWFNVIIPSKGVRLVTPVGPLTFLVLGVPWPSSFLCGPVSNCDTDPLVQFVEVLKIGCDWGACFPVLRILKYDHESVLVWGQ